MQKIVGVRRFKDKEIYYFLANIDDLKLDDKLVVNFDDFQTIVTVCKLGLETTDEKAVDLPKITRRATESDLSKYESMAKKAKMYLPEIKKKSLELKLVMKFVSAEYSLDNSKILIVFSSEERVDFRALLKELASMLKIRIELKQIGQRDEVKCCGGVGICGQQCCCTRFLKDFEHVTVKMAKTQGLSLSPTKINGVCGRLLCCLAYESDMYEEILSKMPKINSEIMTPNGLGTVVYNDILREKVSVKRKADGDTFVVEDFTMEEIRTGKKETLESENVDSMAKLDEVLKKDNIVSEPEQTEVKQKSQNLSQNVKNAQNNAQNNKFNQNNAKNNSQNDSRQKGNRDNRPKNNNFQKNNGNNVKNAQNNNENYQNKQKNNENKKQQNTGMTIVYEKQENLDNGSKSFNQNSNIFRKDDARKEEFDKNKNFNNKRK